MRAQLLCDEHFEEAAQLVLGIPSQALQAERVNAAMTFKTLTDAYARHGRWKEALPHAIKAVEYKPDDHMNYVSLLVLLAGTGALKDYNTHRHACLDLFGEPQNPFFGERIAKACLIFPALGSDLEVADKLAQAALIAASAEEKRDRNRDARQLVEAPGITDFAVVYVSYHQFAKGLADYRQGRFASAAQLMQKSISDPFYGQGHSRYLQSYMVLAMAYYQMNEYDQARAAFDKGVEIEMTKLPALDSAYVGPDWYWRDLVVARALKNEAQSLLEGAASQAR